MNVLTTRHTQRSWEKLLADAKLKELQWETDANRRPGRVPKKSVAWAKIFLGSPHPQNYGYLYVVPLKKGGYLLKSMYANPQVILDVLGGDPVEDAPYDSRKVTSVKEAKKIAATLLDTLLSKRRAERKVVRKPNWYNKPPHRTKDQIAREESAGMSRRDQYIQFAGVFLNVDPDTIPKGEKEFDAWFDKRAFGTASRNPGTVKTKTADGTVIVVPKGKDRFGMRIGSRAARINAVLSDKPKSAAKIKAESHETGIHAHLKKLLDLKLIKVKIGKKTGTKLFYIPTEEVKELPKKNVEKGKKKNKISKHR